MKTCPFCAEPIQDAAVVCRHCGRDLPTPPPLPAARAEQATARRKNHTAILVLVLVAIGALVYLFTQPSGAFVACQAAYAERTPNGLTLEKPSTRHLAWDHKRIIATAGRSRVACDVVYRDTRWIVIDLDAD